MFARGEATRLDGGDQLNRAVRWTRSPHVIKKTGLARLVFDSGPRVGAPVAPWPLNSIYNSGFSTGGLGFAAAHFACVSSTSRRVSCMYASVEFGP